MCVCRICGEIHIWNLQMSFCTRYFYLRWLLCQSFAIPLTSLREQGLVRRTRLLFHFNCHFAEIHDGKCRRLHFPIANILQDNSWQLHSGPFERPRQGFHKDSAISALVNKDFFSSCKLRHFFNRIENLLNNMGSWIILR